MRIDRPLKHKIYNAIIRVIEYLNNKQSKSL